MNCHSFQMFIRKSQNKDQVKILPGFLTVKYLNQWSIGYSLDFKTLFLCSFNFIKCFWSCIKTAIAVHLQVLLSVFPKTREHFTQIKCLLKDQQVLPIVFSHFNQVLGCLEEWINQSKNDFFPIKQTEKNPTNRTNQKRLVPKEHNHRILKTCLLCRGSLRHCFWKGQLGGVVWLSIDCYYHNHFYFLLLKDM